MKSLLDKRIEFPPTLEQQHKPARPHRKPAPGYSNWDRIWGRKLQPIATFDLNVWQMFSHDLRHDFESRWD
jgi:hypothetical protein